MLKKIKEFLKAFEETESLPGSFMLGPFVWVYGAGFKVLNFVPSWKGDHYYASYAFEDLDDERGKNMRGKMIHGVVKRKESF